MFHDFMFGGMWIGWLLWLGVLIVIIWLVVNQMNKNAQNTQHPGKESVMDILEKRFAEGEITKEQFD